MICFKVSITVENLDSYFPNSESCGTEFHAHLETDKNLILKIYFDNNTYLLQKIDSWEISTDYKESVLQKMNITEINEPKKVQKIDFSQSKILKIEGSTNFFENGKEYFLIYIDFVKIVYLPIVKETNDADAFYDAEFYLNDASEIILQNMYRYFGFFFNEHTWEARNDQKEYQEFGKIKFLLDYHFYSKESEDKSVHIIHKEPRIQVKHLNLSVEEVVDYVKLLCTFMSFYRHDMVDYFFMRFHNEEKTIVTKAIHAKKQHLNDFYRFPHFADFHNVQDFLKKCKADNFLDKKDDLHKIVF